MSHLRPIDPATGDVKAIAQYTVDEARSALAQLNDTANRDVATGKAIDQKLAKLMVGFAKKVDRDANNTEASDTLHPEVVKLAAA